MVYHGKGEGIKINENHGQLSGWMQDEKRHYKKAKLNRNHSN